MQIKVVTPRLGTSTLAFSPLPAPRIVSVAGGIDFGHRDAGETPFERLRLLSVFGSGSQTVYQVLLFLHGLRRPLSAAANTIRFGGFPFARSETLVPQLRSFASYLCENNARLAVDRSTYDFLIGRPPQKLDRDVVALATALAEALATVDEVDGVA